MMPRLALTLTLLALLTAACNLTTEAPTRPAPAAPPSDEPLAPAASPSPVVPVLTPMRPTSLPGGLPPPPLPGLTPNATGVLGAACAVYVTYSGPDPGNLLSLRDQPGTGAAQLYKVPNHAQVLLVPGSQEVEAEGYHWLNVIYVDAAQNRYQGWMARDSYSVGGTRNPAISTLRPTGQQASC